MLDVTDRLAVIVGGGQVAARKARGLLDAGATRVRCVSPEFAPEMPDSVERVREQYDAGHLDGAGLVFAATDLAAVNDAVVRDSRARGVLVSRADSDDDQPGDFVTPARLRQGPVTVSVSTGGSAALAVLVRDGILERWDGRWDRMAETMLALRRALLKDKRIAPAYRRDVLRDAATPEALDVLEARGVEGLFEWLLARHPSLPPGLSHG